MSEKTEICQAFHGDDVGLRGGWLQDRITAMQSTSTGEQGRYMSPTSAPNELPTFVGCRDCLSLFGHPQGHHDVSACDGHCWHELIIPVPAKSCRFRRNSCIRALSTGLSIACSICWRKSAGASGSI